MLSRLHPNVFILTLAQALIGSTGPLVVLTGGIIGIQLAPTESLATLPIAFMVIGVALFTWPMAKLFSYIGRKKGFLLATCWGALNALFTAFTVVQQQFWLFCIAIALFGVSLAALQQFRFAAMESCANKDAGLAVSVLLLAGLVAAFLGPELGVWGQGLLTTDYAGSFILVSALMAVACIVLLFFKPVSQSTDEQQGNPRPLSVIAKQPVFIVALMVAASGFAVMSFIMTATPISMHVHHHFDMQQTKWVIQSHVIAMYLPSLLTPFLIHKIGIYKLMLTGIVAMSLCIAIGLYDQKFMHFWWALVLLGMGWNFMFVSGTSLLPRSYNSSEKFKVQGFNDLITFSIQAVVSLSAGWIIFTTGWQSLLLLPLPLLALTALAIIYWRKQTSNPLINLN
ncbi:MFS transporter [Alteromonadaceae bacterium BrNp21-10]|nr:MFS transporter [Alteromonadaceae bacterium BrNp21-10]